MICAIALSGSTAFNLTSFNDSTLWSLIAELIYYTIYPAFLYLRRHNIKCSWLVTISLVIGLCIASTNPTAGGYPLFGIGLNWLLGLPCWLSGCYLAEKTISQNLPKTNFLWQWRIGVFTVATTCSILRFHTPIGYPWTLNFFALLITAWLSREIAHYQENQPPQWLEWAGTWSYSLYLIHVLAHPIFTRLPLPNFGPFLNWALMIIFVMTLSYLFYFIVEKPTHHLARLVAKALSPATNNQPKTPIMR